jgi:hypothetical protein
MAWAPTAIMGGADMAQAKTWAAFDVRVSGVLAATLDRDSSELRVQRWPGRSEVPALPAGLPGPVRATYERGRPGSCSRGAWRPRGSTASCARWG